MSVVVEVGDGSGPASRVGFDVEGEEEEVAGQDSPKKDLERFGEQHLLSIRIMQQRLIEGNRIIMSWLPSLIAWQKDAVRILLAALK